MLSTFHIDKNTFESDSLASKRTPIAHDTLQRLWRDYGIFVGNSGIENEIRLSIKKLPPKFQQDWNEVLLCSKIHIINEAQVLPPSSFNEGFDVGSCVKLYQVGVVSDAVGLISLTDDHFHCTSTGFEVITTSSITSSFNFKKSERESKLEINRGETINQVWEKKFKCLAKYSERINIIDRYLFENLMKKNKNKNTLSSFMHLLTSEGDKYKITIVSRTLDEDQNRELIEKIKQLLQKNKKIKSCTLIFQDDDFFKEEAHDRFIAFDKHVCQVGTGMAIFSGYPIPQTTFTMVHEMYSMCSERLKKSRISAIHEEFISN
jgi:hypothetical protein